MVSDKRVTQ